MQIISQSPCRIGLFGGGTDIPTYSDKYGGLCINLAINLRSQIKFYTDEDSYRITKNEVPAKGKPEFVYSIEEEFAEGAKHGGFHERRFISTSEAELESGLGTSAASAVAIIGAINKYKKLGLDKKEIAEKAYQLENKYGLYSGRQDQYSSALGGFNAMIFTQGELEIQPLQPIMIDRLLPSLILIHTGSTRKDPNIQFGLKDLSTKQLQKLDKIKQIAQEALEPLARGDVEKVGYLLDQSWKLKQESNTGVGSQELTKIEKDLKAKGAYGFKVCGSGGGGYAIAIVDPNKRENFESIDFSVDYNGSEARIL